MITSESNPQIKEIVKLQKSARARRKSRLFAAEGIKISKEAAFYGSLQKLYISERAMELADEELERLLKTQEYEVVSETVFRLLSETVTPQGVLAVVSMPEYTLSDIIGQGERSILLLDDLRDPGNLGTIMRTAEGAGMSGVILTKGSVDLFNPKTVRATMGSIFRVPFYYAENLTEVIEQLKERDIPVYGTMMQGSVLYSEADYSGGAGIVIGNEANGISKETAEAMTGAIRIPMAGKLESLNAAVAAAVLMYEIARQRQ